MDAEIGMKVLVKESQEHILRPFGYSLGTEYPILNTFPFWHTIRITNDRGVENTFDLDRFTLVEEPSEVTKEGDL